MKILFRIAGPLLAVAGCFSCHQPSQPPSPTTDSAGFTKGSYAYDRSFLQKNTSDLVELQDSTGTSKALLSGDFQGRVMTSTATGDSGVSFGWINYGLIASHLKKPHFNPVGGEERFWIGPEGGQYSVYFKKGDSFNLAHWQVPPVIDTIPFELLQATHAHATYTRKARLSNYAGTVFEFEIIRTISLPGKEALEKKLGVPVNAGIRWVALESNNQIRNTGDRTWTQQQGLLSIWLLSMMTPTQQTKVIIPFRPGPESRKLITDSYFGSIPPERLLVKDSVLYFRCDGRFRSKIGLAPAVARPVAASFDFTRNILTVLIPEVHPSAAYVNSKWEIQAKPFQGDVINAYNDGPLQDGTQLGPFYEIESSSPASGLRPGEGESYTQLLCHFQGSYQDLRILAQQILQVDLDEVRNW